MVPMRIVPTIETTRMIVVFMNAVAMSALVNAVPKLAKVTCVGRSSGPLVA